jgi:hypothetical protein
MAKQNRSSSKDPSTKYYVYEYLLGGKVFYVGHTYHDVRYLGPWKHYSPIVRAQDEGRVTEGQLKQLRSLRGQVFAWLIRNGHSDIKYTRSRFVDGKNAGQRLERYRVEKRLSEGCVLANDKLVPRPLPTRDDVLRYLGLLWPVTAVQRLT